MGVSFLWTVSACAAVLGCGAGDTRLDPGDLELRDLLGVSTDVATTWDAEQRAAARRVLGEGLEMRAELPALALGEGRTLDERVLLALATTDRARRAAGDDALGLVHIRVDRATAAAPASSGAYAVLTGSKVSDETEIWISERWHDDLPGRGLDLLSAMARDAGHSSGPVVVTPGPRMPVIASYVDGHDAPARLLVNPVMLAALEPLTDVESPRTEGTAVAIAPHETHRRDEPPPSTTHGGTQRSGNPYSFYGSVAECASAQRARCESCLGTGTCEAITAGTDGDTECTTLGNADGRGYFLICINLSIAITSVERCAAEAAPGCSRDLDAASQLSEIENNANFLDDATCSGALDSCLAEIYGAPPDPFPGLDGGVTPPRPPRDTNLSCSESCDSSNNNCDASAGSCGSGPSCGNSLSCDGACSSSNDQSGCDGNCNACSEDDTGSGGSSGCGGDDSSGGGGSCGSDSSGGGDSCGSGGDSGGSCGGGSDSGGGCGGGSSDSGGGCGGGGSSDSGGGCGGGGGGGSSSSSCNVTRRSSGGGGTLVGSLAWAMLPIPAAAFVRRRSRVQPRRKGRVPGSPREDEEVSR